MRRQNPVLEPFCAYCGQYKGVGECLNAECNEWGGESNGSDAGPLRELMSSQLCSLCELAPQVSCRRCHRAFCANHGEHSADSEFRGLNHHIGKCGNCGVFVCENCWIVDESGNLSCIDHF